jgi:hypothetical protein
MKTASDIIESLGGYSAVAAGLGKPAGTVSAWKTRECIPPRAWRDIVQLADRLGIAGVTLEILAAAYADRPQSDVEETAA